MAELSLEYILTDHAYCEQKAASTCISLIQLFPEKKEMVQELAPVVTEEWGHFRMVLEELEKRDIPLGKQRKDEYALALKNFLRKGGSRDEQLVEKLLMCAIIEARSCERFRLLSLHISDDTLKSFYHALMVSEAGHYKMFLKLAKLYKGDEYTLERWNEWLVEEARIMKSLDISGQRIH